MKYEDVKIPDTEKTFADIRRAVKPVLEEIGKGQVDELKSLREELTTGLSKVSASLDQNKPFKEVEANVDLSSLAKRLDMLLEAHEKLSKANKTVSVSEMGDLQRVAGKILLKLSQQQPLNPTDPKDARDYVNVRLTDGEIFYNALSKMVAAVSEGGTLPFANPDGSAARVTLTSDGKVPVDATVTANATVNFPAQQNVSISGALPTGANLIGAVVLASGVTVAPSTGIQDVFARGGTVALASGISVTPPIQQNVTVSGVTGTVGVSGTLTVTSTSGNLNAHIDNFPSVQGISVQQAAPELARFNNTLPTYVDGQSGELQMNSRGALNVALFNGATGMAGRNDNADGVAASATANNLAVLNRATLFNGTTWDRARGTGGVQFVTVSGALNLNPNATPIGQVVISSGVTVLSTSGTLNAHIDNFPTVQHVLVENQPINQTISGTVGGTVQAVVQNFNPLQESFIKGGQVILASGVSITPPIQQNVSVSGVYGEVITRVVNPVTIASGVAISSVLAASGVNNVHVDNYPSVQSVFVQNPTTAVTSSGTVGGTVQAVVQNFPISQTINGTVALASGITVVSDAWQEVFVKGGSIALSSGISVSGTVGGTVQAVVSNLPTSQTVNGTVALASGVAVTSVLSASGVQNVHIDNYPSVQGVFVNNALNVATLPAVTATSGTLNAHIDNFPLVQSVQVQGTASVSGTVGGTVQTIPQSYPGSLPLGANLIGAVVLASGVTVAPNTGLTDVSVRGGSVALLSGVNQGTNPWTTSGTVGGTVQAVVQNYPGSLPTGGNLIGAVVLASGITVSPNTGLTDVSVRGGSVALLSGVAVTSVLAASGVNNVHVDNFPSTQGVFVNNSLNVATLPAVTAVSGTLNAHIDNWPSTQHVFVDNASTFPTRTLVSGTDFVNVGNFPTGITTVVQNVVSVSGTVANAAGNTLAVSGTINGNVTVVSTSGNQSVHVDNWPNVQHSFIENSLNVATLPNVTSTSGTLNSHIDNWPTVQHVFVENPTTSVSTSGTVGGTVNAVVQNFNPLQEAFIKGGAVVVASGVAVSSVLAASGVQNVHVDNYPTVQAVTQNGLPGNWTVNNNQVAGTTVDVNTGNASAGTQRVVLASNQPSVTVSGASSFEVWSQNTSPIKSIYGSAATLGVNTLISGITGQYIKVSAFSLLTASTTAVTPSFVDANAVGLWQPGPMQAIASTSFGANLATEAPSYLFKTSATGLGLNLNLSAAQTVYYALSYWYDPNYP